MSDRPRLRLEYRKPSELAANPANWRTHPAAQLAALSDVISEVGWAGVLLYNETTQRLIDGHARKEIAARGDEPVPVVVGAWTEAEERTILATLDPIAAMAEADAAKLDALLSDVQTGSGAVTAMLEGLARDAGAAWGQPEPGAGGDEFDPTPEAAGPARTKPGDLWVIGGKHRLLVGDCTLAENVARLMGGAKVGLCFTSPPYAQQRDYGEATKEKVQDWHGLMCGAFACLPMTDAGQVLVNLGLVHREGEWVPYWDGWVEWMRVQGWRRFGWYVWDQGSGLPGDWNGRLAPSHEWLFHFNRIAKRPVKHVEANQERAAKKRDAVSRGLVDAALRAKDGTIPTLSSPDKVGQTHKTPDSVLRLTRHMANDIARLNHPATFPVALPAFVIECWPSDVYDPFLGSGTTLVAAHRLGRICYGCEIEPRYADVILKRAEAEGLECVRDG